VTAHATASKAVGALTSLKDTGRERFFASEFYNDFWRRSGLGAERIAANLVVDKGAFASFVVQTPQHRDEVDSDTVRVVETVVPHLIRAIGLQRRLRRLTHERDLARAAGGRLRVGAVLVDRHARVVATDAGGEAILRDGSRIALERGTLRCASADDTLKLHALVASCADTAMLETRGGVAAICRARSASGLHLEVIPYLGDRMDFDFQMIAGSAPVAIVLIADPTRRQVAAREALQRRFGLTPAESAFALEILKGDGREAAAARLGISLSTARTHLSRIFEKVGVNRQAELVRVMSADGFGV